MKRFRTVIIFIIVILLSSCVSTSGDDGAPSWAVEVPSDRDNVYGVGSAKMTNEKNSRDASYGLALTSVSSALYPLIEDAASSFTTDLTASAFETIRNNAVSALLGNVERKDEYTSADGTVWTIVSVPVRNLPSLYQSAADDYVVTLEEKRVTTEEKLDDLLKDIAVSAGEGELSSDTVALQEKAEAKAAGIIAEIDSIEKGLETEKVVGNIRKNLKNAGYRLE